MLLSLVTVAASSKRKVSSERGHLTMNENATTNNRRGSVDGVIQRCGLCSLLSSLLRRAMCVGSRRGSGESYYQELAETSVSFKKRKNALIIWFMICEICFNWLDVCEKSSIWFGQIKVNRFKNVIERFLNWKVLNADCSVFKLCFCFIKIL